MWFEANDAVFVRYLLGELPDEDRDRLEDEYLEDDSVHERLLAVECELIDAYVRGDLSPDERRHFEDRFIATPEGREKVAHARSFEAYQSRMARPPVPAEREPRRSWRDAMVGFFRFPVASTGLVYTGAGLILVAASLAIVGLMIQSGRPPASAGIERGPALADQAGATQPADRGDKVAEFRRRPPEPFNPLPANATAGSRLSADVDPFPDLRGNADRLRSSYVTTDAENMREIDRLLKARDCQMPRVGELLDRTIQSMHEWLDAERLYWGRWADIEAKRAGEIDTGDKLIKDGEARLREAQKGNADLGAGLANLSSSISARISDIDQNRSMLEEYARQMTADYERTRAAAKQVCDQ